MYPTLVSQCSMFTISNARAGAIQKWVYMHEYSSTYSCPSRMKFQYTKNDCYEFICALKCCKRTSYSYMDEPVVNGRLCSIPVAIGNMLGLLAVPVRISGHLDIALFEVMLVWEVTTLTTIRARDWNRTKLHCYGCGDRRWSLRKSLEV